MGNDRHKIAFHYLTEPFSFPERNRIKDFLLKQLEKEKKRVEAINYIFCDDQYLFEINKKYLNHETLTDIITFELSLKGQPLLADVYISVQRVKENASLYKVSFRMELLRVVFHGALHLAGYKDKKSGDRMVMREKEGMYLDEFISRGTYHKKKD